jgi:very-short-patch-repair endonuclease
MLSYSRSLKKYSRDLRKQMTEAEQFLWSRLRRKQLKGLQFYRQKIIGSYIADFYCAKAKLVIELDGSQHYGESGRKQDRLRDDYMTEIGLSVIRFSDRDVFENIDGVMAKIWENLRFCNPHNPPNPPLRKGGEERRESHTGNR